MVQIGNINIAIPGGQMYTEEECLKRPNLFKKNSMLVSSITTIKDKATGKKKTVKDTERIVFNTRTNIPATIVVPIYDEAYEAWISNDCPSFSTPKVWKKLNPYERAVAHVNEIVASHNGKLVDWSVNLD